jgi:integrase
MTSRPKVADRVVKHILADGTTKEYRYPRKRLKRAPRSADCLAELIAAYQRSPEWKRLAATTQRVYEIYLRPLHRVGHIPAADVKRRDLLTARDQIADTKGAGAAMGFVRAVSALFAWGVRREWLETNVAIGCTEGLPRGHLRAWTRAEADAAQQALPEPLRRVVVLARYTAQRRGDLCALRWSDYDGATIRLVQEKTRAALVLPVHPALKVELDAWQADRSAVTILTDNKGVPWKPNLLSHYLPDALLRIGLSNELNVHGLRKLAATELADAGCSAHEIAAITGHRSLSMVQLYTRSADQERLAGAAIIRLSSLNDKRKKTQ